MRTCRRHLPGSTARHHADRPRRPVGGGRPPRTHTDPTQARQQDASSGPRRCSLLGRARRRTTAGFAILSPQAAKMTPHAGCGVGTDNGKNKFQGRETRPRPNRARLCGSQSRCAAPPRSCPFRHAARTTRRDPSRSSCRSRPQVSPTRSPASSSQRLAEASGQAVVVENRPGGAGAVGAEAAAGALATATRCSWAASARMRCLCI